MGIKRLFNVDSPCESNVKNTSRENSEDTCLISTEQSGQNLTFNENYPGNAQL